LPRQEFPDGDEAERVAGDVRHAEVPRPRERNRYDLRQIDDFAGVGQPNEPAVAAARQPKPRRFHLRGRLHQQPSGELLLKGAKVEFGGAGHGLWTVGGGRLADRSDLLEELVAIHRLHDVVARALPHSPDLVGLLALRRAQDDGNGAGIRIAADGARRLDPVQSRHHDVHEDQVGLQQLRLENGIFAVVTRDDLVTGLGQHVVQYMSLRRRVVDDENLADRHSPTLYFRPSNIARRLHRAGIRWPRTHATPPPG